MSELERLRWRCRRGMLELDLMLQQFVDDGYRSLDSRGREALEALLQLSDQELFDYLLTGREVREEGISDVIEAIRCSYRP
jgi:antitoxin CptB